MHFVFQMGLIAIFITAVCVLFFIKYKLFSRFISITDSSSCSRFRISSHVDISFTKRQGRRFENGVGSVLHHAMHLTTKIKPSLKTIFNFSICNFVSRKEGMFTFLLILDNVVVLIV